MASETFLIEPTLFRGQLSHDGQTLDVVFTASVDTTGELALAFETQTRTEQTAILHGDGPGRSVKYLRLDGQAEDGSRFSSDRFFVTGLGLDGTVNIQGACGQAEIVRHSPKPVEFHQLVWFFRRLTGFRQPARETELGLVILGAKPPASDQDQRLTGAITLQGKGGAPEGWFTGADEELAHVARVMSFATGVVLRPYVERRVDGDLDTMKINSRSNTPAPFLEPFVFLNQEPIFAHACAMDAEARARFKTLDGVVSWLLAPGYYDEIRLVAAMTALENLVDELLAEDTAFLAKGNTWKRLASAVRAVIEEHQMPEAMKDKVPELRRRAFDAKLDALLDQLDVARHDLSATAVSAMIGARNVIVHKGVYFDPDKADQVDLWEHLLLARELVTRILLAVLGFKGNYFAPLYSPDQQLRFPSCQPLTDAQGREIPETPPED